MDAPPPNTPPSTPPDTPASTPSAPPVAPATPTGAPPTVAGPISDARHGRLPASAKVVAWVDVAIGGWMLLASVLPSEDSEPAGLMFGVFLLVGVGVLLRSNLVRIFGRIAHGLAFLLMVLAAVATVIGLLSGGAQGQPAAGGAMTAMMIVLMAWSLGIAAFLGWGFFVLGRKDVRLACRPRAPRVEPGA